MTPYKNLNGNSGVIAYNFVANGIEVQFKDSAYLYTNASAGTSNIEKMRTLAIKGRGLSTFISTTVRHLYDAKLW